MKNTPEANQQGIASRRLALEVLVKIEQQGAYANIALSQAFDRKTLSERDRAFVTALVQGVTRSRLSLDQTLGRLCSRPLSKMPPALVNVLRLGLFQLMEMKDIPESAVVNTCVELSRITGHQGSSKFANAVLRTFLREQAKGNSQADGGETSLSIKYSVPAWLVEKWIQRWGQEETIELLKQSQAVPELTLRVCQLSITAEGLAQIFAAKGIKCHQGELVNSCLVIDDRGDFGGPPEKLPGYKDGLFTIQDEAAAFVCLVLAPQQGDLVLDLCAAPGGKSLHLAELMENKGRVVAADISGSRLNLLKRNRNRLGLTNIEIVEADGRSFSFDSPQLADKILIDAPCTGTGVMNRRSDLRFRRQAPDTVQLVETQRQLLSRAAGLLKPGGILVYSTCSLEVEENEDNLRWFLAEHPQFKPQSLKPYIPGALLEQWQADGRNDDLDLDRGYLQLMPSRHRQSGFFVARLLYAQS